MTLALYGKSRKRQAGLLLAAFLAVMVAMLGAVANITGAFAHHLTITYKTPTCADQTWSVTATTGGWSEYREAVITAQSGPAATLDFAPFVYRGSDRQIFKIQGSGTVNSTGTLSQYTGSFGNSTDISNDDFPFPADFLGSEMGINATTTVLTNANDWHANYAAGKVVRIDNEFMKIVSVDNTAAGNPMTVTRGFGGTAAVQHKPGLWAFPSISVWNRSATTDDVENWSLNAAPTNCEAKIIVKKVVEGAGSSAGDTFSAQVVNDNGASGEASGLPFSQSTAYTHTWAESGADGPFRVLETGQAALGYTAKATKVLAGNVGCDSTAAAWDTTSPAEASGGELTSVENGDVITVCFFNEKLETQVDPNCENGGLCGLIRSPGYWKNHLDSTKPQYDATLLPHANSFGMTLAQVLTALNSNDTCSKHWVAAKLNVARYPQLGTAIIEVGSGAPDAYEGQTVNAILATYSAANAIAAAPCPNASLQTLFEYLGSVGENAGAPCWVVPPDCVPAPDGNIIIKKVKDPTAGVPAADASLFGGNVDTTKFWGNLVFGGATAPIAVAPGTTHTAAETATENGWTPIGWAIASTDGNAETACPPAVASYSPGVSISNVTVLSGKTTVLCVMNSKIQQFSNPIIAKVKHADGATPGGLAYWTIGLDNSANLVPANVIIDDTGATYVSVTGGTCSDTSFVDGDGLECTVNASSVLLVKVSKPAPAASCQPQNVNNSATAWVVPAAGGPNVLIGSAGGDDATKYTIEAQAQQSCLSVKKEATGTLGVWNITFTNTGAAPATVNFSDTYEDAYPGDAPTDTDIVSIMDGASNVAGCIPAATFPNGTDFVQGCETTVPANGTKVITVTTETATQKCMQYTVSNSVAAYLGTGNPQGAAIAGTAGPQSLTAVNVIPGGVDCSTVTFVKLLCDAGFTPVASKPINYTTPPPGCVPMPGWTFYTGTTWDGQTLGGTQASYVTGANGTVMHTLTASEFEAAHAYQNNEAYLVREEERAPFTRAAMWCHQDADPNSDNIEIVNLDDFPTANAYCIAYNMVPRINVNLIKLVCDSLSIVPNNTGSTNPNLAPEAPTANVALTLANIVAGCDDVVGWTFETGITYSGGDVSNGTDHVTVANGVAPGLNGAQHLLTAAEWVEALDGYEDATPRSFFVEETEQVGFIFGAIKCYADHNLDDKIERIDFKQWGIPTGDVYCLAFNVKAEREITITKHFVSTGNITPTATDLPTFTLSPNPFGAGNYTVTDDEHCDLSGFVWTCTVPSDWVGTVTETPAAGWEETVCEPGVPGLVQQILGLVQEVAFITAEPQSDWTFCNQPNGKIIVHKVYPDGVPTDGQEFTGAATSDTNQLPWADAYNNPSTGDDLGFVHTGSYTLTEDGPPAGYDYLGYGLSQDEACGESQSDALTAGDFKVGPGETVNVYVCNQPYAFIEIIKVDGTNGAAGPLWGFTITGTANAASDGTPIDHTVEADQNSPFNSVKVMLTGGAITVTEDDFHSSTQCAGQQGGYFTEVTAPADNILDEAGETLSWTFSNQPCALLGTGGIIIEKWNDVNGDGDVDPEDSRLSDWEFTTTGGGIPAPQQVKTTNGNPAQILDYVSGFNAGTVLNVTETTQADWILTDVELNGVSLGTNLSNNVTVQEGQPQVIRYLNTRLGSILVDKTTVNVLNGQETVNTNDDDGWKITLSSNCLAAPIVKFTDPDGEALFEDLPICNNYVVTEDPTSGPAGYQPVGGVTRTGIIPGIEEPTLVNFTNETRGFTPPCTNCGPTTQSFPTPTPTPVTPVVPTPTSTPCVGCNPGQQNAPTATPDPKTPTNTPPPSSTVAGERTPGATPIAPSTGEGTFGSGGSGMSLLLILGGLGALAGGITFMAMGRKSRS